MRKLLVTLFALVAFAIPASAQQLNVGVAARKDADKPVVDIVPMQKIASIYLYSQITIVPGVDRPEITLATEIPVIDTKHFYLGLDNGIGWYGGYGRGVYVLGATVWVPVYRGFGGYGMVSGTPTVEGSTATIQAGIFKQLF